MKTKKPARTFRIVDAVAVAAVALLALKAVAYLATPAPAETGPDGLPNFGRVFAQPRSNPQLPDPETTGSVPEKPKPAPAAEKAEPQSEPKAEPAQPKGSAAERAIRDRLGERREELQRQARDLETREKLIEEAERRADAKVEEARLSDEKKAAGNNPAAREAAALKGLVVMYETMKPKDAARVFDKLPEDVLVPVVRQIAPRKMAEILAAMSPDTAQKLTIALARPAVASATEAPAGPGLPPGELPAIEPPKAARAAN